ncbi:MAG TPA: hypothetical protein VM901_03090 [Bdellovibrionota bacterium]|jgi:hypothetical protein|nr:hypothetical protein [Bdellovibrionota bacterium]
MNLKAWVLIFGAGIASHGHAQGEPDDLRRGVAVLREESPLLEKPEDNARRSREELEVGESYFVMGLSLDGEWAQLLTLRNARGWVRMSKIYRLPDSDPELHEDFMKLLERTHWNTSRVSLTVGAYPELDVVGEAALTLLPRGFSGLKGETFDLIGGAVFVKTTDKLPSHVGYRGLLQWSFRLTNMGNLYIGPRGGVEFRKRYNPVGLVTAQNAIFGVAGLLFRYMPNPVLGFSFAPEFLIHSQEVKFHAYLGMTLMF